MAHRYSGPDSPTLRRMLFANCNGASLRSGSEPMSAYTTGRGQRGYSHSSESDSSMDYNDAQDDDDGLTVIQMGDGYNAMQIHHFSPSRPTTGLLRALDAAQHCKDALRDRQYDQALSSFVQACRTSIFTLAYTASVELKLSRAFDEVESRLHMIIWADPQIQLNLWAARCVLGGYSESKTLDRYQLKKMKHDPYWKYTTAEVEDTYYIGLTGRFRAFYKVAWQHEHKYLTGAMTDLAEVTRDEYSPGKSEMNDALLEMFSSRQERHPITLQSDMMLGEFQQRHDPAPNADAQMAQGFHHCLLELEDPAMAIQHITFCMFEVLKACRGYFDERTKDRMIAAANEIMNMHEHLRSDGFRSRSLWDIVKDRLLSSLLLLSRTFDLAKILTWDTREHSLVTLINLEYAQLQEQNEKAKLSKESDKAALRSESSLWSNNSRNEDEHDFSNDPRCERCTKRVRQLEQAKCDRCNVTIYCSQDCLKRGAMAHRTKCKRLQLKQKHTTQQSSARIMLSP